MHYSLLTWINNELKHLKGRSQDSQIIRSGEISSSIFETHKNSVLPHGCHIYNAAADMNMTTMCNCTYKHNRIPHWKCVLHCCYKCLSIFLHSQEENKYTTSTCPTIRFHVYLNVSRCTVHRQRP